MKVKLNQSQRKKRKASRLRQTCDKTTISRKEWDKRREREQAALAL